MGTDTKALPSTTMAPRQSITSTDDSAIGSLGTTSWQPRLGIARRNLSIKGGFCGQQQFSKAFLLSQIRGLGLGLFCGA